MLTVILLLAGLLARAEHYYFKQYQVDDGLLHNNVTSIIQDRLGFMWIGTRGGLNRFDGHTFKNNIIKWNSSGANYIKSIREDHQGILWIGTITGIFKFNPVKEAFESFNLLPTQFIRDIKIDSQNNLWIIARGSLYHYNPASRKLTAFNIKLTAFDLDNNGNLWFASTDGYIKKLNIWSYHVASVLPTKQTTFEPKSIIQISAIEDGILIGTPHGLYQYQEHSKTLQTLLSKNEDGADIYVRQIYSLGSKHYIATESGVFIYDTQTRRITHLKKIGSDSYALNDNAVYAVFADNRQGIWVGTFFGGLNYYAQETSNFEKYYPLNTPNSISGNAVREICEDSTGNIWIGTEDAGINKLDTKTGLFSHITHKSPHTGLSYPNIHGLLVDGNRLFAGPFIHGLEIMDLPTGKITNRYPRIRSEMNRVSNFVMSIYKTSDQRILIGTTGSGLYEYQAQSKTLINIPDIPGDSYVYDIEEDHTGTIWTGSLSNGAFYYNPKTGKSGNISFNQINDTLKYYYTVQGIYEDSKNNLWFATEGGGLIKMDSSRRSIKRFTTDNGLPTNNTYRILEDDFGNLWISSIKGLLCFNIHTEKFHVYTKSNGLITDQFNYNSAYKDKTGKMYFGTVKGMVAFYPKDLLASKTPPPIYITNLQVNNKDIIPLDSASVLKQSTLFTDTVVLGPHQTSFNVEFAALDFASSDAVKYKYKMEGLDTEWTYLKSNRKVYFTGLAPGIYRFIVQAESNVGYWQGKPKSITFIINPPFWKSLPAYLLYVLLLLTIILLSAYWYQRTLKKKNQRRLHLFELEKEREVYQAKIEFFTNIAHEIQTPLTLIKGPIEWALSKIEDTDTVKRNLQLVEKSTDRLVTLTTQLLDFRKMEIDQFGLNFVLLDISALLNSCIDSFRAEIEQRQLTLKLDLPQASLKAPVDREAFLKIMSNLISNAIKYSKSYISINLFLLKTDTKSFKISIVNDGRPIPPMYREKIFEPFFRIPEHLTLKGTGIGLPLAKSLAELHGGDLRLVAYQEQLNVFELTLPNHQATAFKLNAGENLNAYEPNTFNH